MRLCCAWRVIMCCEFVVVAVCSGLVVWLRVAVIAAVRVRVLCVCVCACVIELCGRLWRCGGATERDLPCVAELCAVYESGRVGRA